MPKELVEKLKKSRTFNQGFATAEYLEAALLDMAWHSLPADAPLQDVNTFEPQALQRFAIAISAARPAITRRTSRTSGAAAMRPVTTRTSGAKCSTTTRITVSRITAA